MCWKMTNKEFDQKPEENAGAKSPWKPKCVESRGMTLKWVMVVFTDKHSLWASLPVVKEMVKAGTF